MTDLPQGDRERLAEALLPPLLDPIRVVACDGGATSKTLWRAFDGTLIEGVLMRYPGRATVCVSSQAGCGMACPFCATGQAGLTRNLSAGEIVDQVVGAARQLSPRPSPPATSDERARDPGQQRRLHGHGRAAGQLQRGPRRRPPA